MIQNLPRKLLWTDIKSISEFMSNEFGNEVVSAYSFAYSSKMTKLDTKTMLKLYNEAFYLSTRIVYERDAKAHPETYMQEVLADIGDKELAEHVIRLMYMLLLLQSDKAKEILQFTDKLRKEYLSDSPFLIMKWSHRVITFFNNKVGYRLSPCPNTADILQKEPLDWNRITQGFSQQVIFELLDLWDSEDEKGKVIRLIEQAYMSLPPMTKENEAENKANEAFFTQQKNLYGETNEDKKKNTSKRSNPIPLVIKDYFPNDNEFVRNAIKKIVDDFYQAEPGNLALIEKVLIDHKLLIKHNKHEDFIRILKKWGILNENVDEKKTANLMSSKMYRIKDKDKKTAYMHYENWNDNVKERHKCICIWNELSELLKYNSE